MLGAVPRLVRLSPPKWELPRAAVGRRVRAASTKAIMLNSPMNPTGKVFTAAELAFIADLLTKHDAYAVCDEVYEHLTYRRLATYSVDDPAGPAGPLFTDRQRRQDV